LDKSQILEGLRSDVQRKRDTVNYSVDSVLTKDEGGKIAKQEFHRKDNDQFESSNEYEYDESGNIIGIIHKEVDENGIPLIKYRQDTVTNQSELLPSDGPTGLTVTRAGKVLNPMDTYNPSSVDSVVDNTLVGLDINSEVNIPNNDAILSIEGSNIYNLYRTGETGA
jgi:hypothetical protein